VIATAQTPKTDRGALNISIRSARNYIRSIYNKLHLHSKSEVVTKALGSRLVY